jgi:hypothetical protein
MRGLSIWALGKQSGMNSAPGGIRRKLPSPPVFSRMSLRPFRRSATHAWPPLRTFPTATWATRFADPGQSAAGMAVSSQSTRRHRYVSFAGCHTSRARN